MKILKKGAEADVYLSSWNGKKSVLKIRKEKTYRNSVLDKRIRKQRTIKESEIISQVKSFGVSTPLIYFVDINKLPKPYATKSVANLNNKLDLESCQLRAPDGFNVNIFAKNLQHPRNIKVSKNGDIFVIESNLGKIKILRDTNNDGVSDINQVFAEGFNYFVFSFTDIRRNILFIPYL